jgi:hypothetical protein
MEEAQTQAQKDPYALSQELACRVLKSTMNAELEADAIKVGGGVARQVHGHDCMGSDAMQVGPGGLDG